jgi:hypothetical protein
MSNETRIKYVDDPRAYDNATQELYKDAQRIIADNAIKKHPFSGWIIDEERGRKIRKGKIKQSIHETHKKLHINQPSSISEIPASEDEIMGNVLCIFGGAIAIGIALYADMQVGFGLGFNFIHSFPEYSYITNAFESTYIANDYEICRNFNIVAVGLTYISYLGSVLNGRLRKSTNRYNYARLWLDYVKDALIPPTFNH